MQFRRREFLCMTSVLAVGSLLAACGEAASVATAPAAAPSTAPVSAPAATATSTPAAASSAAATTTVSGVPTPVTGAAGVSPTAPLNPNATLTFYNAQHENLVKPIVDAFTKETGVKVNLRAGKDFDMANQIVQEGASSPADLFITENSPAMQIVAAKGLFAPVDKATLAQIPARYSPTTGDWIGVAARATVLVYNSQQVQQAALPKSLLDLATPAWQGKVGIAAAGADFQAIVSAVLALSGPDATLTWLKGLKANAKIYSGNGAVMRAVNAGEIATGVIYHYYWYQDRAESGQNSKNTELYFFPANDPGAFLSISGLGVLKGSKSLNEAQALVRYMTGKVGQQVLADSPALEYSLNPVVPTNSKLKPLSELRPPDVDVAKLNGPQVVELMQQAGLL